MKVLVPVEDPIFALHIVNFINKHKWPEQTEFMVMHVVEPIYSDEAQQPAMAPLLNISPQAIIEEGFSLVSVVAQALNNCHPRTLVNSDVIQSEVVSGICRAASEWNADLVVMGSHGRSGFNRFCLGSAAMEVASKLLSSLLIVKPDKSELQSGENLLSDKVTHEWFQTKLQEASLRSSLQRILVAIDDTTSSANTIEFCCNHLWSEDVQFRLLSVIDAKRHYQALKDARLKISQQLISSRKIKLEEYAQKLKSLTDADSVEVNVVQGAPRQIILQEVDSWGADLLVVGNHLTGAGTSVFRGVAMTALTGAACSVLVVKKSSSLCESTTSTEEVVAEMFSIKESFAL